MVGTGEAASERALLLLPHLRLIDSQGLGHLLQLGTSNGVSATWIADVLLTQEVISH